MAVGPDKPWRQRGPGCGGQPGRARGLETEGTSLKWQVQRHLPPLKFSLRAPGDVTADSIRTKGMLLPQLAALRSQTVPALGCHLLRVSQSTRSET